MTTRRSHLRSLLTPILLSSVLMTACGGGNSGGGGSNGGSSAPTFTVSASPATITLTQGATSEPLQVSVVPQNGFSGTVTVTVAGLPTGVTAVPSSISVAASAPESFSLSAATNAQISQQSVTLNAVSGTLNASASFQLTVAGVAPPDPFHAIGGSMIHGFFDESRHLLFATNLGLNELEVISGTDFSLQARIPVAQPVGIDQMADGHTLVIGTAAQQLVTVDEDTHTVTQHPFTAAGLANFTLFFPNVVALANGKVIVIGQEEGIDSNNIIDAGQFLYIWDTNANTFTQFEPNNSNIEWETDSLARSADHKWAVFAGDQFYLYSSDSDSLTSASFDAVNPPDDPFGVRGYSINSDGSEIAVVSATQVTFLNNSLAVLGTAAIPGAFQTARSAVQFSADGSKLYLEYPFPLQVQEIDAAAYTALGYLSATVNPDDDNLERMLASDAEGHGYFGIDGGVRIVNLAQSPVPNQAGGQTPAPPCPVLDDSLALNTPLQQMLFQTYSDVSVYVGGQAAPLTNAGTAINIPASSTAGSVDVVCVASTGDTAVNADGLSYGVDPIALSANLLPPSGNPPAYLFGFGFSGMNFEVPNITIGGVPATNVVDLQDLEPGVLQGEALQIPNGNPGEIPAIAVSSSAGSGTLSGAATYYASPTIVPASGLLQLLFDTHRNLLYALKPREVDVLDPNTLEWKTPLTFPSAATGTYNVMALTPDGSKLVIAGAFNQSPQAIVMDPSNSSSAQVVTYSGNNNNLSGSIAVTASNVVLFTGFQAIKLDLSSLAFSPLSVDTGQLVRATPDGTHIFGVDLNISSGTVYAINPVTFAVQTETFAYLFWADLAVAPDGTQFAPVYVVPYADGDAVGFFSPSLQYLSANVYPDLSPPDDTGAIGATYSPGGKVLAVPLGDSIEFWDTAHGTLRARLMTPEELQVFAYPETNTAPILALDISGQTIYAISASGLTVIKLAQPLDELPSMPWPQVLNHSSAHPELRGSIAARMAAIHGTSRRDQSHMFRVLPQTETRSWQK